MVSKKAWPIVVFVFMWCSVSVAWDVPNTVGREFVFAIPSDYVYRRTPSQRIFLTSQTGQPVSAQIVAPGINFLETVNVPADEEATVDLPTSCTSRGIGLKRNTIRVIADGEIGVHVQMEAGINSGAFTPIPNQDLGRDYVIGIYEPLLSRYRSGFIISASARGALLEIVFSRGFEFGHVVYDRDRIFKFHLQPYESFQVMSEYDLTGTRVRSDHPIAVVAGSECSRVPHGVRYCDYLVEQLPPVHTFGKHYIVAPFKGRGSSYVLRVVAPFNGTEIHFASDDIDDVTLSESEQHELVFTRNTELSFQSTKPILVLQYTKGFRSGDFVGDPSMVTIPSIEQFPSGSMTFASMSRDHVTITITNTNTTISGLRLNGEPLSGGWTVIADDVSGVLHGTLESGLHTISHKDPRARFFVVGYGTGYLSSRAFPVAYNLRRLYVPSDEPLLLPPRGYEVICGNVSMAIYLDTSVFLIGQPRDVTLNDPSCQAVQSRGSNVVVLTTNFDGCDTRVQEHRNSVTFSNTLWFAESVITPVSPLRDLPFKCVLEQQMGAIGLTSPDRIGPAAIQSPLSDDLLDNLTLSLIQYMDDTFGQPATGDSTTDNAWADVMVGSQGQNVFAVNLTSSADASVFVDSCWTTPGPDAADANSKDLAEEGCALDDTIRIGASIDDPHFRPIAVDSFDPIGEYHEVYMHCRVQVCRGSNSRTLCAQECRRKRKRRDTTAKKEIYTVSSGPIRIN